MFWTVSGLILLLILGFVMLSKGSDFFVDGAASIAKKFKIPQLVIGLTVVAMGTSAPETAVSISSAIKGSADMAVGNVVGSNILNVLIILGLSATITKLAVQKSTLFVDIPVVAGATILLFVFGLDGNVVWWEGLIFLVCFVTYIIYLILQAKKERAKLSAEQLSNIEEDEIKEFSTLRSIIYTVLGLGVIIGGSYTTVYSAEELAKIIGLSKRFIGLTVVALGTSLPELFTSVTAAMKHNADIAIGNIVGSCIFNILLVLGLSAVVTPVPFANAFRLDTIVAFGSIVILFVFSIRKKTFGRVGGIVMLLSYLAYFLYILLAV